MTNQPLVDFISQGLINGLPHPGDPDDGSQPHAIILPVFNTVGQPPEIVEQTAGMARSLAEAIAFLIEEKGMSVVDTTELNSLRTSYDPAKGRRIVSVHCQCDTALLMLSVTDGPKVVVDGGALLSGFRTKHIDCPHGEVS
jgi:hypothetical protein